MIRPVAFTDHATRRPVNLRAECDARGADYPNDPPTDPGAYRAPRPARTVSRWRPTRYVSVDGVTWLRHTVRGWTYRPTRVRGRRAAAHYVARRAARPSRLAWVGDVALLAAVAVLAAVAWIVTPV